MVNNRDLREFTVDIASTERLAPRLAGATLVAESGVKIPGMGGACVTLERSGSRR